MSLQSFQQALSELVLSAELRSRVTEVGSEALAAFELDEREERRLVAVARQRGLGTGVMIHRSFRLSMLTHTLPRTCQLLGKDLGPIVRAYWHHHLPRDYQYVQEACRFSGHLRRLHEAGHLAEEYLLDVLRLDLGILGWSRKLAPEQVGLRAADLATPCSPDSLVLIFEHEPEAVLEALDAGQRPEAPAGDFHLAVRRLADGTLQLEPATVVE